MSPRPPHARGAAGALRVACVPDAPSHPAPRRRSPPGDKWLRAPWCRWNPLAPDLSYRLDLSERDGALVARALVELAVSEPGENWAAEALDGAPLAGPSAWADRMPAAGTLEVPPRARPRAPGRRAAG